MGTGSREFWYSRINGTRFGSVRCITTPQRAVLTCHVGGNTCRIKLELDQESDGERLIPIGISDYSGTCNEFRRRRGCIHTLAAFRQLRKVLEDEKSELRNEAVFPERSGRRPIAGKSLSRWSTIFWSSRCPRRLHEAPPQTRIAWRVEHSLQTYAWSKEAQVRFSIDPYEQKIGKGGQWTKGRRIQLDEFLRNEASWAHEADRRFAEMYHRLAIKSYSEYSRPELKIYDMLEALAGHPLITWSDNSTRPDRDRARRIRPACLGGTERQLAARTDDQRSRALGHLVLDHIRPVQGKAHLGGS